MCRSSCFRLVDAGNGLPVNVHCHGNTMPDDAYCKGCGQLCLGCHHQRENTKVKPVLVSHLFGNSTGWMVESGSLPPELYAKVVA